MSDRLSSTTTYLAGCHTCQGLAVWWDGPDAKAMAIKHARQTAHKGIWYNQTTTALYEVTDALTTEDWDELERQPRPMPPPQLPPISDAILGQRIFTARRAAKLTQADLAERIGVGRTTLVAMEQGQRRITYTELCVIAAHIGISMEALIAPVGVSA